MLPAFLITTGLMSGRRPAPFQSRPSGNSNLGGKIVFSSNLVRSNTTPVRLASVKSAPQISENEKSALVKLAPRKFARRKLAPRRLQLHSVAFSNTASEHFVPATIAQERSAFVKFAVFSEQL